MDPLRSTFPLDEAALARATLRQILTDPISWVPLLPPVAAYAIFNVPGLFALAALLLVLTGLVAYWRGQWTSLVEAGRRAAIAEHNRAQDLQLAAAAQELRQASHAGHAVRLEQFLALKRQIESRLHEDGALTAQKIQIEQLVDALCFGVRDRFASLAAGERGSDLQATEQQVDAAFATLQSTAADLDLILGPADPLLGAGAASIEEVTRRLREEAEIARRVQARLHAEQAPASAPPVRESETA